MRVLLTGATGFLGRHLAAQLLAEGHGLVCADRNPARAMRMFPGSEAIACDFVHDVTPEAWTPRLAGIDAVINCAGILQASDAVTDAVHTAAPVALFDACVAAGVPKVLQISALGADAGAGTAYADSKHAADLHLAGLDLDWTVVKPSLVYTPAGSYGGTSLFRAMAALPLAIPVVGDGGQSFQPIHMDDFAAGVVRLLETPARAEIIASGPEPMSIADILMGFRGWLGLAPAPLLKMPRGIVAMAARLGDLVGGEPINSTSLRMMDYGNTAPPDAFIAATGITPRGFAEALAASPAHVQDRWHARLYFLRPLLRITLGLFWVASGVIAAFFAPRAEVAAMLTAAGFDGAGADIALWATAAMDVALGLPLLLGWRVRLFCGLQVLATLGYLAWLSIAAPLLWLAPLGPLVKTVPAALASLILMAIEDDG